MPIRETVKMKEGAGAEVARLMPVQGLMNFDPFVLMDHFTLGAGTGFPDHPHRGFEAITYLFKGSMQHKDNMGNQSVVHPGGAQRFTAGSGIVHSEMPGNDGVTEGIQLWINLPKQLKTLDAEYQEVQAEAIPDQHIDGATVRRIVGEDGPVAIKTDSRYEDVNLQADKSYSVELPREWHGFVYVVEGSLTHNGTAVQQGQSFLFEGGSLAWHSSTDTHFIWAAGRPHHEPIIQHGPYVD